MGAKSSTAACPVCPPQTECPSCPECPVMQPALTVAPAILSTLTSQPGTCKAYLVRLLVPILNDAIENVKSQELPAFATDCPVSTLDHLNLCNLGQGDIPVTQSCNVHIVLHELEGLGTMRITSLDYELDANDVFDVRLEISTGILRGTITTSMSSDCSYALQAAGYLVNCNRAELTLGDAQHPIEVHLQIKIPLGCTLESNIEVGELQIVIPTLAITGCGILTAIKWIPSLPSLLANQVSLIISTLTRTELSRILNLVGERAAALA